MIDAVLFDLGDTIIDFGVGRREAEVLFKQGARLTYDYLDAKGLPVPAFERYFRTHYRHMQRAYAWSKLTRRDFNYGDLLARVAHKFKLTVTPEDLLHLAWLWYKPIGDVSHIDPGILQMLVQLRAAGTRLAIVSNTFVPGHCLDRHLREEGLLEFFPVRIYSSDVRYRKPHPRIFEMALEQIGVPADKALFIGDLLKTDIRGAKRAGMRTIWKPARAKGKAAAAASGGSPLHEPIRLPRKNFLHPRRLHAPDFIIPKVTQLPEILHQCGWRPVYTHGPVVVPLSA
jgi:putative hydrolase of the HAD superfamily